MYIWLVTTLKGGGQLPRGESAPPRPLPPLKWNPDMYKNGYFFSLLEKYVKMQLDIVVFDIL